MRGIHRTDVCLPQQAVGNEQTAMTVGSSQTRQMLAGTTNLLQATSSSMSMLGIRPKAYQKGQWALEALLASPTPQHPSHSVMQHP